MRRAVGPSAGVAFIVGITAALGFSTGVAADTSGTVFHPPQRYYLALGDSLAFGFHEAQFNTEIFSGTYDPASFNDGYDSDLFHMFQPIAPPGQTPLTEVNYGCPGETTSSMVGGSSSLSSPFFPCPFHYALGLALHNDYPAGDSQLQAAVAFLQQHRGHVNPVTLDIGPNDLLPLLSACGSDPACVGTHLPGVISTMTTNLNTILSALQSAEPSAEVVVMNMPDPFALYFPASIPVIGAFDSALNTVVAAHNDRLVDAYSNALVVATTQLPSWCADVPAACTPFADIHPFTEGYTDLAEQFFSAAGYTSLPAH